MRDNLRDQARTDFFTRVLKLAQNAGGTIIRFTSRSTGTRRRTHMPLISNTPIVTMTAPPTLANQW